jgi:3-oxo-5alpha-steroid 4-dehydrogenase
MRHGLTIPDILPVPGSADVPCYDVVVVGFGISGGCAALEAARAGATVLLLERAGTHGGTSSMSGGHFYLGGGTPVQQATGQQDSAEDMAAYLIATAKDPDEEKIRAYAHGGRALRLAGVARVLF